MTSTFTWAPDYNTPGQHNPRVFTTNYGDGYQSRLIDGLNYDLPTWELSFTVNTVNFNAIIAFLNAQFTALGGLTSFYWTPPDTGVQALFICKKWKPKPVGYNNWNISATFEQVVA